MTQLVLFILITIALRSFAECVFRVPSRKAGKIALKYADQEKTLAKLERVFVVPIAKLLAKVLPVTYYKEVRLSRKLRRLDMPFSGREYIAKAVVLSVYTGIPAAILFMLSSPMIGLLMLVLAIMIYFHITTRVDDLLKAKTEKIIFELPRFIRTFIHGMRADKDIITILEKYSKVAGNAFRTDLKTLIADMKLGNHEEALVRFDESVDISQLSNFITSLISHIRGEDQRASFAHIANDMSLLANENLKRILAKRPGMVKAASIPMVVVIFGLYLFVIGASLVTGLGTIM